MTFGTDSLFEIPARKVFPTLEARRIVLTGASGALGPYFVDALTEKKCALILVGRNLQKLRLLFPEHEVATYDNWSESAKNFDTMIHLAVANNDRKYTSHEFKSANVDLPLSLASTARDLNFKLFINFSTYQIFDNPPHSDYVKSKIDAKLRLDKIEGINIKHVILPYVKTHIWRGKVSALNNLPLNVSNHIFYALSAFKPTVVAEDVPKAVIDDLTNEDLLLSQGQTRNYYFQLFKTSTDLAFSFTLVALFWWLLVFCWLIVKLTSKGPGVLKQFRVGRHGKVFICYKFRTMYLDTPTASTHELSESSVTPVGKFLRATKLDELPQFFNILSGSMSLIGPRPCLPIQTELIEARQRRGVYLIKPGITGLAQVKNIDMKYPEYLAKVDQQYIKRQSILLEIRLIFMTFLGSGRGDRTKST